MIVVSDASPIVALARVGHLELLRDLYSRVVAPMAVHAEVRAGSAGIDAILAATWIEARVASDHGRVQHLLGQLGEGEAQAIALTLELNADLLLMDERRGRRLATDLGIRVIGTLGMLVDAKRRGLVAAVAPLLDAMVSAGSFRVAEDLRRRVLEAVGEDSSGS